MFKSYWKTSLRFLANNKGFSLLNIVGLSIGTLCCIYILLYVKDQYSYDRYFSHADNTYRVISRVKSEGSASIAPAVGAALAGEFSDMLVSTRVIPTIGADEHLVVGGNAVFYEKDAYLVDSNFFDLFDFHFVAGDPEHAFTGPNSIVLLKSVADKLFNKDGIIGTSIQLWDSYGEQTYKVSGVVDETGGKSSIHANMFIRMNPSGAYGSYFTDNHWLDHNFTYTFIRLKPGVEAGEVEKKLPAFFNGHTEGQTGSMEAKEELQLQPIREIHTTGGLGSEMSRTVSGFFLAILIGIAALIQIIACINFMNLSTARASKRAKEVGVRKIIGADNRGLVVQFLVESFLISLLAMLITMPLLITLLPWLNRVTGAEIPRTIFFNPVIWCGLAFIAAVTGLLAGSYPAFYLSAFRAHRVLKGDFTSHVSATGIRKSLVVFQFLLSIVLITSILIIRKQLDYIKNKDLGFKKDEQIVFNFHTRQSRRCAEYFAMAMRQFPDVSDAAQADNYPGSPKFLDMRVHPLGTSPTAGIVAQVLSSDEHFIKTMGISLVSGRDLQAHDTGSVIINQTLAQKLGLDSATAPGTRILGEDNTRYKVAGVMKDFNYQSLHDRITPFMILYRFVPMGFNHLIVRVNTTQYSSLLERMAVLWRKRVFVGEFDFRFLSDSMQKLYETEIIMSRIINSFTVMAILISCLGLFGLAAFSAEQRTKEIGIRKVMGASVPGIVQLLSKDFFVLICVAILLAVPVTWWAMTKWLSIFAYHIRIEWWMFAAAGGSAIVIAMTVVGFQAFKVAVVNPAKSLRAD
jgi:putative ABC transport system permease protein